MSRRVVPRFCTVCRVSKKTVDFSGHKTVCSDCRAIKRAAPRLEVPPNLKNVLDTGILNAIAEPSKVAEIFKALDEQHRKLVDLDRQRFAEWAAMLDAFEQRQLRGVRAALETETARLEQTKVELRETQRARDIALKDKLTAEIERDITLKRMRAEQKALAAAEKAETRAAEALAEKVDKPLSARAALRSLTRPQLAPRLHPRDLEKEKLKAVSPALTPVEEPSKLSAQISAVPTPSLSASVPPNPYGLPLTPPARMEWVPPFDSTINLDDAQLLSDEGFCPWGWLVRDELPAFISALRAHTEGAFPVFTISAFASAYWRRRRDLTQNRPFVLSTPGAQVLAKGLADFPFLLPPAPFADIYADQTEEMQPLLAQFSELLNAPQPMSAQAQLLAPATSTEIEMLQRSFE